MTFLSLLIWFNFPFMTSIESGGLVCLSHTCPPMEVEGGEENRPDQWTFVDWLDLLNLCGLGWPSVLLFVLQGGLTPEICGIVWQTCPLYPHTVALTPPRRQLWLVGLPSDSVTPQPWGSTHWETGTAGNAVDCG